MTNSRSRQQRLSVPQGLAGRVWLFDHGPVTRAAMHRHAELEINLVNRGRARYIVDGKRYDLLPSTQLWLFPAQNHVLLDQSPDFQMWIVVWRQRFLAQVCRQPGTLALRQANPRGDWCRHLPQRDAAQLRTLCEDLATTETDRDLFNAGLAHLLMQSWRRHREAVGQGGAPKVHPGVERAAMLLRDGAEDVSLAHIARATGFSPSGLSRLWKEQTGTTLVEFRARQCLERFLELYGEGYGPTALQAALASGFGSYAQFARVFRRSMGKSLAQYRRDRRQA